MSSELLPTVPLNIVDYLDQTNFAFQDAFSEAIPVYNNQPGVSEATELKQKYIFVCTFCQVFSSSSFNITNHIRENHGDSLQDGTLPENYVSKLKSLNNNKSTEKIKADRQRKSTEDSQTNKSEKLPLPEPVLDEEGVFWCIRCNKHFNKIRQYNRHVCIQDINKNGESGDEVDCDKTADFKVQIVQPDRWLKRKRMKYNKTASESINVQNNDSIKMDHQKDVAVFTPNWKDDPKYVPTFKSKDEKDDFDQHLKSINIDYKHVDTLYENISNKSKYFQNLSKKKKLNSVYCCKKCKKVLHCRSNARNHCLTHTDLKPFTCPKCSFSTNVKGSLHFHMRTHTGNLFHCTECDFQSNKRSHLMDHVQIHYTVQLNCKLCKNIYKTLKSLKSHVTRYHNTMNGKRYLKSLSSKESERNCFKCDVCDKDFVSSARLQVHKKSSHSVTLTPQPLANQNMNLTEISASHENSPETVSDMLSDNVSDILTETVSNISNENVNLFDVQNVPVLQDCNIRIEPIGANDQSIPSLQDCSVRIEPLEIVLQRLLSVQNCNATIKPAVIQNLTPLQDCSIRIEPLENGAQRISLQDFTAMIKSVDDNVQSLPSLEDFNLRIEPLDVNIQDMLPMQGCRVRNESLDGSDMLPMQDCHVRIEPLDASDMLPMQDCSVRIEPLDAQIINYYQYNSKDKICDQTYASISSYENDETMDDSAAIDLELGKIQETGQKSIESPFDIINFSDSQAMSSLSECSVRIQPLDEQLVELMLNNLLQDKSNPAEELFGDVFSQTTSDLLNSNDTLNKALSPLVTPEKLLPLNDLSPIPLSSSNILEECLKQPSEMLPKEILQSESQLDEPKPEEIQLFEKCRKAPAYVCCVCSGIFICTTTLKAHLKEHVDNSRSFVLENAVENRKTPRISEKDLPFGATLSNILQESSNSEFEKELEKLYTSSLHKMWYLPEVSVVLENDQSIIEAVLEDISDFPINDKFDDAEDLQLDAEIFS